VSEIIIIGLRMFSTLMEQTGKGELYSANGSAEESCWISSQPQPSCTVALEACGGAHHWARQLTSLAMKFG
jgi:transposase